MARDCHRSRHRGSRCRSRYKMINEKIDLLSWANLDNSMDAIHIMTASLLNMNRTREGRMRNDDAANERQEARRGEATLDWTRRGRTKWTAPSVNMPTPNSTRASKGDSLKEMTQNS
ncbi:unnamed protein product [Soboliphyme baturini]|uniref:Uncharacterized protein n=1 Tax=Soboliphyme baturini TaxID=241478 RepID=A0A183J2I4_9BILA|nr:unnamed protein product [Soboliphyme baturini]